MCLCRPDRSGKKDHSHYRQTLRLQILKVGTGQEIRVHIACYLSGFKYHRREELNAL